MADHRGMIAIMGSGETTDSMVRVHRFLLDRLTAPAKAVFIDTPAGFQMNADDLYEKAREYFEKRLNQPLSQVSFKAKNISPLEAEKAYQTLRQADYIFVGPGSPTYALRNWVGTPISQIILNRVQEGACFVAASAAALTLGLFTLPVYEIYKVGEELRWVAGLNLLESFGLPIVVIPHWNNAEGGTHDTRFCYMGEPRLIELEAMLPPDTAILGIDEHTACILDFEAQQVFIRGIGEVTLRHGGVARTFKTGEILALEDFKKFAIPNARKKSPFPSQVLTTPPPADSFMGQVQSIRDSFDRHLKDERGGEMVDDLVDLDKFLWKAAGEFEDEEKISQAREVFRGMIVQLGLKFEEAPKNVQEILSPLLKILLDIREKLRQIKQWNLADAIRDKLVEIGIIVEDTPEGPRWYFKERKGHNE